MGSRIIRRCLAALLLCLIVPGVWAEEPLAPEPEPGFTVLKAESRLVDGVVRLNSRFELRFSEQLVEALQNGVTLNLLVDIDISKQRNYLWSKQVTALQQRYQISFQPLTNTYVLINLNSELEFHFPTLESVLAVVATLHDFPLLDFSLLEPEANYRGQIRIAVDRDSFPVPLRLMSYVSGDWYLESDWFSWPLLP